MTSPIVAPPSCLPPLVVASPLVLPPPLSVPAGCHVASRRATLSIIPAGCRITPRHHYHHPSLSRRCPTVHCAIATVAHHGRATILDCHCVDVPPPSPIAAAAVHGDTYTTHHAGWLSVASCRATLSFAPAGCRVISLPPPPLSAPAVCHVASRRATLSFAPAVCRVTPPRATTSQCALIH